MTSVTSQVYTDLISLDQLRADTGLSSNTLSNLAREGGLPVRAVKIGRRYFVSRKAWEEFKVSLETDSAIGERVADQHAAS